MLFISQEVGSSRSGMKQVWRSKKTGFNESFLICRSHLNEVEKAAVKKIASGR